MKRHFKFKMYYGHVWGLEISLYPPNEDDWFVGAWDFYIYFIKWGFVLHTWLEEEN